ncbi:hypothetical protein L2E82_45351 [Cichorium intybus]|uniref:Uncharacterized protein n=1 Tax=Cichorium intybus TaxID=13427 RepID=A0ACB8ZU40_CICIN|nr:hypothetical protein L2E82_45351 [Cichorium intybus]
MASFSTCIRSGLLGRSSREKTKAIRKSKIGDRKQVNKGKLEIEYAPLRNEEMGQYNLDLGSVERITILKIRSGREKAFTGQSPGIFFELLSHLNRIRLESSIYLSEELEVYYLRYFLSHFRTQQAKAIVHNNKKKERPKKDNTREKERRYRKGGTDYLPSAGHAILALRKIQFSKKVPEADWFPTRVRDEGRRRVWDPAGLLAWAWACFDDG